jgi:hypothetical protein
MKAFGLPRFAYNDYFDKQEALEFGVQSKIMKMHGRHDARRIFKKKERANIKHQIFNDLKNIN